MVFDVAVTVYQDDGLGEGVRVRVGDVDVVGAVGLDRAGAEGLALRGKGERETLTRQR